MYIAEVEGAEPMLFPFVFTKGDNFGDHACIIVKKTFQMGSTLQKMNFILGEQILPLIVDPC